MAEPDPSSSSDLLLAVVTGAHAFDTIEFTEMFRSLPGINPVIQHLDDWCYASPATRARYDVVLFYTMWLPDQVDEGLPWYAGKQLAALGELGENGRGIVVLHHGLVAFRKWQPWSQLTGIPDRTSTAHWEGGHVTTEVADTNHPITRGLPAYWTLDDESYQQMEPTGPDVHVLLTTRHEPSMRTIGWTNTYKRSRVFCYQSGHGAPVFTSPHFRHVLAQGIAWTAHR